MAEGRTQGAAFVRAIGGYFGLELEGGEGPYSSDAAVNFGRGGLELILKTRGYTHVWLPCYICPCVPQYLSKIGIGFSFYEVNENLEPCTFPQLARPDAFLYVDYFGIKDDFCRQLETSHKQIILDLTQAFYYKPIHADGFNSARKFFGVPDGGFVFGDGLSNRTLPDSFSFDMCDMLLRRADGDLAGGYSAFKKAETEKESWPAQKMSKLTHLLLSQCDGEAVRRTRMRNFRYLHARLEATNKLPVQLSGVTGPLVYPYLPSEGGGAIKAKLIQKQVFCPTFWPNLANTHKVNRELAENLVCLPIDQRYSEEDMDRILDDLEK